MSESRNVKTTIPDAATVAAYWRLLQRLFGNKEPPPDAPPPSPPQEEQPEEGGERDG